MKKWFRRGKVKIGVEDRFFKALDDLIRNGEARTLGPMVRATHEIMQQAKSTWPVKTGKSKAGLQVTRRVLPNFTFISSIGNEEAYVRYIHLAYPNHKTYVWTEIRKMMRRRARTIASEISPKLVDMGK